MVSPSMNSETDHIDLDRQTVNPLWWQKLGIATLLLYTLLITVLRSVRAPNDFAKAYWLLDYRFGFVKRGLAGEFLSSITGLFGVPITLSLISVVSGAALAAFSLLLIAMCLRLIYRDAWSVESVLVSLVFLSSPFIVLSAHIIGYYDNIVFILGILSIFFVLKRKVWLSALIQVLAFLVHEIAVVIAFLPYVFVLFRTHAMSQTRSRLKSLYLPIIVPATAFLAIAACWQLCMVPNFADLLAAHLSKFPFIGRSRNELVPQWLVTPPSEYFSVQSGLFFENVFSLRMLKMVLPSTVPILFYVMMVGRIRNLKFQFWLIVVVCLAPLVLLILAWDTPRLWSHTILLEYIVLWIFSELNQSHGNSVILRYLCILALLLNTLMVVPLLDPVADRLSQEMRLLLLIPSAGGIVWLITRERGIRNVLSSANYRALLESIKEDWRNLRE